MSNRKVYQSEYYRGEESGEIRSITKSHTSKGKLYYNGSLIKNGPKELVESRKIIPERPDSQKECTIDHKDDKTENFSVTEDRSSHTHTFKSGNLEYKLFLTLE